MIKSYFPYLAAGAAGAVAAAALSFVPFSSHAETRLLPFQGRLTNAAGNAIDDGVRVVEFKMYNAPTGGDAMWAGEVHKLSVNGGLVNTMLGSKARLADVDFALPLFLQITVDANGDGQITAADPPLLPRQSVIPAVFASESGNSRKLNNADWSTILAGGSNDPATGSLRGDKLAAGSVGTAQLAAEAVKTPQIANDAVGTGQIADGSIQSSDLSVGLQQGIIPPGTVVAYAAAELGNPPPGWAECRGASVSRTDPKYKSLYGVIKTNHGAADQDHFNLPDYRGLFLRGISYGSNVRMPDPDREGRTEMNKGGATGGNIGSVQPDEFKSHDHPYKDGVVGGVTPASSIAGGTTYPRYNDDKTTSKRGGEETRPKNAYVNYIIKL